MIDYNEAIRAIKDNNGFKPNKKEDSFYRTYTIQNSRPIQIRISNHGTHLWTWYDKDYDPSYAINICVVFSKDGSHSSDTTVDTRIKDEQGNIIGERKPFEVKQFVYNCQNLDNNDAALINMEIQNTWKNGGFQDPLAGTPKQANVIPLRTNNNDNNTDIKKENIMRNKRTYRLTENRLRGMIREAVKNTLNEISDDLLKRAEEKARNEYDDAWAKSPYWDDWDNEYPEHDKFLAKRKRQMKAFRDELRNRGSWEEGNGWDIYSDN